MAMLGYDVWTGGYVYWDCVVVSLCIYFANGLIFLIMCVSEHKKAHLFIKLKLHLG